MINRPDRMTIRGDSIESNHKAKMPSIWVLFKASKGCHNPIYVIPSTHHADDEKDYPLLFDIHRCSEAEEKALV